jgi:protein-tyrosine phosphatase
LDQPFVDIHCHILPSIDDGAADEQTALAMARMAASDGMTTIIATPHQLGNSSANRGDDIRARVRELQALLASEQIDLTVLPGADVRIEEGMLAGLRSGDVLTLGDHGRHVLLELPHELYFPLDPVLSRLQRCGIVGILSHPERNDELLHAANGIALLAQLVDRGCLLQVTAGSLLGSFGPACQQFAEELLAEGLVHFLATDAHGLRSRRPLLGKACERAADLVGTGAARQICCENPRRVAEGVGVPSGRTRAVARRGGWRRLVWGVNRRKAG